MHKSNSWHGSINIKRRERKKNRKKLRSSTRRFFLQARKMWKLFAPVLLAFPILLPRIGAIRLGIIANVSLVSSGSPISIVVGTCEQCICQMVRDNSFFALNCFTNGNQCEMHPNSSQDAPFQLSDDQTSTFYFLALPTMTPVATTALTDSRTTLPQSQYRALSLSNRILRNSS